MTWLLGAAGEVSAALPPADEHWIELKTQHFVLYSNASERTAKRVATDLEELRLVLSRLASVDMRAWIPVEIVVFKSDASFVPYKPKYNGEPANVAGYFLSTSEAAYIAIDGGSKQDASSIIYHEYVHHFLNSNLPSVPLWFGEGLAELYQSFEVSGSKVTIGQPLEGHIRRLRESKLLPLEQLFAVEHDSPEYNEQGRQERYYAQCWALAHYLIVGNRERTGQLATFLNLVLDGVPNAEAFTQAFGSEYTVLEQELHAYLQRAVFKYLEQPLEFDLDTSITVRDLAYPRVLCLLGDLLTLQEGEQGRAQEHFTRALELQPGYGPALAGLGYLAKKEGRWDDAVELYGKAAAAAPEDSLLQYRYGTALLQTNGPIELAVEALRRCTRLDATFEPAWVALCRALASSVDQSEEALNDVETALNIMPDRMDIAFTLLNLYLRIGRRSAAWQLLDNAFRSDPGYRRRARILVLQDELQQVYDRIRDSRLDEAMKALAEIEAKLQPGEKEVFSERIEGYRSDVMRVRLVDQYNLATQLVDEGRTDEARAVIEELLEQAADGPMAESARSLLYEIDFTGRTTNLRSFMQGVTRFNELIAERKLAEAIKVLEELKQLPEGDAEWIDTKIAETRRLLAYNGFVERYNQAVDHYNAGNYAQARQILQDLLPGITQGPETEMALDLLDDIRKALKKQLHK